MIKEDILLYDIELSSTKHVLIWMPHEKTKTNNALVHLSFTSDFPILFVSLSPNPIHTYWRKVFILILFSHSHRCFHSLDLFCGLCGCDQLSLSDISLNLLLTFLHLWGRASYCFYNSYWCLVTSHYSQHGSNRGLISPIKWKHLFGYARPFLKPYSLKA